MQQSAAVLIAEAMTVYLLVLWVHSLRHRVGLGPFYALLGGLTAVMSWVTDAGIRVSIGDLTFMVGSTVFYTAILLGVFVVYVFDGPGPTRIAILTVAGMSTLVPVIALVLHAQMGAVGDVSALIPRPSLRINAASVLTTVADMLFLAVAWEFMGRPGLKLKTWTRVLMTLLGVIVVDVVLFTTGAFAGAPDYLGIMSGSLLTRLVVAAFASPLLFVYLDWQNRTVGAPMESRPVLAIFMEVAKVRADLEVAREEIDRRKAAEQELERHRQHLEELVDERTRDLTHANEELLRANEAKETFLAKMSHELRTPLNSIIGFSDVLVRGLAGPLNDEQSTQVTMVNLSGKHLLSLINDVLDLSKLDAKMAFVEDRSFDPADVVKDVAETIRPLADAKSLVLRVDIDGGVGVIRSDPGKIKQILLNLAGNAVKFTTAGEVEMRLGSDHREDVVFSVRDTGPGIREQDLPRVFDAFTQLDLPGSTLAGGTGLGLTLTKRYAEMLGGQITVVSEEGKGSTFTLRLPVDA